MNSSAETDILRALAAEFRRAASIIERLRDGEFRKCDPFTGSLGQQFRHDIDAARCLLRATHLKEFPLFIDYAARDRDPRIEIDRGFAAEVCKEIADRFESFDPVRFDETVLVRSETNPDFRHVSTLGRELEFVFSHTVHHHALIGAKMRALSVAAIVDAELGLAPSTRRHQISIAKGER